MTIKFVLLVNKQGQTRLSKYTDSSLTTDERRALEAEIVRKCLTRVDKQVRRCVCHGQLAVCTGMSCWVAHSTQGIGACRLPWQYAAWSSCCLSSPLRPKGPYFPPHLPLGRPPARRAVQLCGAPQLEGGVPTICLPVLPSGHR